LSDQAPAFRIARGPGNLCRAFGIDRTLNGADLTRSTLTIRRSRFYAPSEVRHTPRIGIDYAGAYVGKRWRLCVRDEPAVSGRR
jgi:DNA-3-methyladenine glycosylase